MHGSYTDRYGQQALEWVKVRRGTGSDGNALLCRRLPGNSLAARTQVSYEFNNTPNTFNRRVHIRVDMGASVTLAEVHSKRTACDL
jgi:hypothetical protein